MHDSDSPTLILLPGLDGTGNLFAPLLAALPTHIRTQVISYPPATPLSLAELADLVESRLPPGRIMLLAESFSGLVALTLLGSRRLPIDRLIFCNAFGRPPRPLLMAMAGLVPKPGLLMRFSPAFAMRMFCLGADATAEQLSLLKATLAEISPEVLAHRLRLISTAHPPAPLQRSIPCHYLQAKRDRLIPASAARWFKENFASFKLESVEGPHFLLQAEPEMRRVAGCMSCHFQPISRSAAEFNSQYRMPISPT